MRDECEQCCGYGCMLNIEGRLRRRGDVKTQVLHVAEVLAEKTGSLD